MSAPDILRVMVEQLLGLFEAHGLPFCEQPPDELRDQFLLGNNAAAFGLTEEIDPLGIVIGCLEREPFFTFGRLGIQAGPGDPQYAALVPQRKLVEVAIRNRRDQVLPAADRHRRSRARINARGASKDRWKKIGGVEKRNTKYEYRNPKQIQNSKSKCQKCSEFCRFGFPFFPFLNLFRISIFRFRISLRRGWPHRVSTGLGDRAVGERAADRRHAAHGRIERAGDDLARRPVDQDVGDIGEHAPVERIAPLPALIWIPWTLFGCGRPWMPHAVSVAVASGWTDRARVQSSGPFSR